MLCYAMQAGDALDAMFRRALVDFPEHSPTALSEDPWVLQFENLVSAEDAQALVQACTRFERSLAGDQLSPVRTSTQCWCGQEDGCALDGAVH